MRICLIAEGSYPYVTGGVSSWIQSLVTGMPEHEFVLYAIGAEESIRGKFKYNIPDNLVEIREVFLDSWKHGKTKGPKTPALTKEEKEALISLFCRTTDWKGVFGLMSRGKIGNIAEFLSGRDFLEVMKEAAARHHETAPFTDLFWSSRSMMLPLLQVLMEKPPEADVYHSVSTGYAGVVAGYGKYLYGKPFVLTEHGIYTREREEEIIKADWLEGAFKDLWISHFYNMSHCAYEYADQVITLFEKNRQIQVEIGCPADKIAIIPNGVDLAPFRSLPGRESGDGEIHIGAIVRVVPIKDIKTMLQSFALVQEELEDARFYIYGPTDEDPEYYEECLQLAEALQLTRVVFAGSVPILEHIGRMDLLVLSSISEGQPLAVLEGMAAGKPFVCTDVGSCSELLNGRGDGIGPAGYIVPVMDHRKMAEAILRLARHPDERIRMGRNGQQRVAAGYARENVIRSYKAIYEMERKGRLRWPASASG